MNFIQLIKVHTFLTTISISLNIENSILIFEICTRMLSFDIENLIFGNGLDAKLGLTLFDKMKNGLCPDYLASLLPATVWSASTYPLRNFSDLQTLHTNSRLYYTSFLPSVVRD